jgi:hypothetical protein
VLKEEHRDQIEQLQKEWGEASQVEQERAARKFFLKLGKGCGM